MAAKRQITSYPGVRFREHSSRKHGVKFDRYFFIRYKLDGKDKEEGVGRASDGMTAEKAHKLLAQIRENIRNGSGPSTLAEMRELAEEEKRKKAEQSEIEKHENLTFSEFFEKQYIPATSLHKHSKSVTSELQHHKNWIAPVFKLTPLQNINLKHVEKIIGNMKKAGRTTRSIQYILSTVSQVWNYAKSLGIVEGDSPTRKIKIGKLDNERVRFLTESEAQLLLNILSMHSLDLHGMAILSLFAGLRAGEIFKLKWSDIDLETNLILIRSPKSGKTRHAYITPEIKQVLNERSLSRARPEDLIFPATNGKQRVAISKVFSKCVNEAGLNAGIEENKQKVVFHTLRHTFASWLAKKGVPLYTIQALMGHSSFQMVQRYAHLSDESKRSAVEVLNGILPQVEVKDGPIIMYGK